MAKGVTPDSLLHGAWYALCQSAYLLEDAVLLFGGGRSSTAAGLALLSREELGKFYLLLGLRKDTIGSGKLPSVGSVKRSNSDHVTKQRWGQTAVVIYDRSDNVTDKFAEDLKQHPEREEVIWKDFYKLVATKRRRDPNDRHERREKCFYVDQTSSGADWNLPWRINKKEAERLIIDAKNDYHMALHYLREPQYLGAELHTALDAWTDKPEPPFIVWSKILAQLASPVARTY